MSGCRRPGRWVALLVAVVALAGCDWAQIGFGAGKTNFNPSEPALSGLLRVEWSVPCRSCRQPLVAGGLVYVAEFGAGVNSPAVALRALDASTGAEKWSVVFRSVDSAEFVAIGNGLAYVELATSPISQLLLGFDATTGVLRWGLVPQTPGTGPVQIAATPVLDGSLLFVAAVAGDMPGPSGVSAIDPSGNTVWFRSLGGFVAATAADPGRTLYVASWFPGPQLAVLTGYAENSGMVTSSAFMAISGSVGGLAAANGLVYGGYSGTGTAGGGTFAIHPDTGTLAWNAPGRVLNAVSSTALLSSNAGALEARDATTGASRWSGSPAVPFLNAVIAGGLVVDGENNAVTVRSLSDGSLLGKAAARPVDRVTPSNGHVYAPGLGTLYALAPG